MGLRKLTIPKNQKRSLQVKGKMQIDESARTVSFPFSSEEPVARWDYNEVLSHQPGAFNIDRMNDGGAFLWNHNWDIQIGVVEKCWLEKDGRLWVTVRFSKNPKADEVFKDVIDEVVRNVSFGYQINAIERMPPVAGESMSTYIATEWEVYEVSFAPVPADPSVGVGRSKSEEMIELTVKNEQTEKGKTGMNEQELAALKEKLRIEAERDAKKDVLAAERARVESITAMCEQHKMPAELARELIKGEKSIEDAKDAILSRLGVKQKPVGENDAKLGLSDKEIRQFSIMRAIRSLADPNNQKLREAAKFELEVSAAAAAFAKKDARGIMIPYDILSAKGMTVGTAADGGNLVGSDFRPQSFIEILRNKMVLNGAGAQILSGLSSDVTIPKQTGAATAYHVAEDGSPSASKPAIGQLALSPKTLAAYTDISRKLMIQSSMDVENMVKSDLAAVIALAVDYYALYGTGSSNQPTGLKAVLAAYNSASQEKNFAAATPTFAEVVDMESKIGALNADVETMSYLFNASMRGSLKTKEKSSGYPVFLLENGEMNGYKTNCSNQIASGDIWLGNWSDLIIGFFSGIDLMVDPYSLSTSGAVRVTAFQDYDVGARHEGSFCRGNDNP